MRIFFFICLFMRPCFFLTKDNPISIHKTEIQKFVKNSTRDKRGILHLQSADHEQRPVSGTQTQPKGQVGRPTTRIRHKSIYHQSLSHQKITNLLQQLFTYYFSRPGSTQTQYIRSSHCLQAHHLQAHSQGLVHGLQHSVSCTAFVSFFLLI